LIIVLSHKRVKSWVVCKKKGIKIPVMTDSKQKDTKEKTVILQGYVSKRLSSPPVRVLSVLTGFSLVKGILYLVGRYLLAFRKKAQLSIKDNKIIILSVEWSIMGKIFKTSEITAPVTDTTGVQLENRKRYIHIVVGFGFLAIGVWVGIQWLVDGLRAGYPLLALIGAAVVAAGIAIDLILYLLIPQGEGKSRMTLAIGPWFIRLTGIKSEKASRFIDAVNESLKTQKC
jgi:hypothetical protein